MKRKNVMRKRLAGMVFILSVSLAGLGGQSLACHKKTIGSYYPTTVNKVYRTTVRTPAVYAGSRSGAKRAAERKWENLAEGKFRAIEARGEVYFRENDKNVFWEKGKHKKTTCKKITLKTSNNPPPGDFFCKYSAMVCQGGLPIKRN